MFNLNICFQVMIALLGLYFYSLSSFFHFMCLLNVLFFLLDRLQDKKQEETDSKFFTKMPCDHYIEVTQLLLKRLEADSIFFF